MTLCLQVDWALPFWEALDMKSLKSSVIKGVLQMFLAEEGRLLWRR
jgi:hypothetical protein